MTWSRDLFGTDPELLPIAGLTRTAWQDQQLAAADSSGARLLLGPQVVASAGFLRAMLGRSTEIASSVRAVVAIGAIHEEFGANLLGGAERHDDELHYDLVVGGPTARAIPALVDQLTVVAGLPSPGRPFRPTNAFDGDRFIWAIGHWFDLLVVNLLAGRLRVRQIRRNSIDRTADVHPTAVVEKSIIGAGVTVGPNATVANSQIGAACSVAERAGIRGAIVGERSVIQAQSLIHGSVLGPSSVAGAGTTIRDSLVFGDSTISAEAVARSVIGPDTILARGVSISTSTLLDASVSVGFGRGSAATGAKFVGCAIGRGARVGNGITIPAGYTVTADANLAEPPASRLGQVITDFATPRGQPASDSSDATAIRASST